MIRGRRYVYGIPVSSTPALAPTTMQSSVEQYGITWTFDQEYPVGQYCNGDYFVVANSGTNVIDIDPASYASTSGHSSFGGVATRYLNGSMINPRGGTKVNGFDNGGRASYTHEANIGWEVSSGSPLVLSAGDSLVSTRSLFTFSGNNPLETAAVLTVVESPPMAGSFRPPFSGLDKTMPYTESSLIPNLHLLKSLEHLSAMAAYPDWSSIVSSLQRVDLGAYWHEWERSTVTPTLNVPNYGRMYQQVHGAAILMLNMDFPIEDKMETLIHVCQRGIDLWGGYWDWAPEGGNSGGWFLYPPNGGHSHGRFWPILFTGFMIDHEGMKDIGSTNAVSYVDGDEENGAPIFTGRRFHENAQTFRVRPYDVGREIDVGSYEESHIEMPEWGIRHTTFPSQDREPWNITYRSNENASTYQASALAAMVMGLRQAWNNDSFFDYTFRYNAVVKGTPELYPRVSGDTFEEYNATGSPNWRVWPEYEFTADMWDEYALDAYDTPPLEE